MFSFALIETAIGLILVFLIMSLICSALREMIESVMKHRAVDLERGIRELLHDSAGTGLTPALYAHPLVCSLFGGSYEGRETRGRLARWLRPGGTLPSYIPSANFARALLDLQAQGKIDKIEHAGVTVALRTLSMESAGDVTVLRQKIEEWFDSSADRVSGWYKRRTQAVLLVLGFVAAGIFNVDSLAIGAALYTRSDLRAAVVASAESVAAAGTDSDNALQTNVAKLNTLAAGGLPVGWSRPWKIYAVAGWLITGLAVTFGAPFWFDILNKVISLRSAVKPAAKTAEAAAPVAQSAPVAQPVAVAQPVVLAMAAGAGAGGAVPTPVVFQPNEWRTSDPTSDEEGDL